MHKSATPSKTTSKTGKQKSKLVGYGPKWVSHHKGKRLQLADGTQYNVSNGTWFRHTTKAHENNERPNSHNNSVRRRYAAKQK